MITEKEFHRLTRRSLITGIAAAAVGVGGWKWILGQEEEDGIPWPLRRGLLINERLGRWLHSNVRLTVRPTAPPAGTEIRVNGMLGLLDPASQIQSGIHVSAPEGIERELTLSSLKDFPFTRTRTEFKCIEGWTEVFSYSGIRFSEFMHSLSLRERYSYVGFETTDRGYYVSVDMESMLHPQTLLAFEMNDTSLTRNHGGPIRLLIPVKYGIKSLKQIGRIFFSNIRPPDYWAERGYDWFSGL